MGNISNNFNSQVNDFLAIKDRIKKQSRDGLSKTEIENLEFAESACDEIINNSRALALNTEKIKGETA